MDIYGRPVREVKNGVEHAAAKQLTPWQCRLVWRHLTGYLRPAFTPFGLAKDSSMRALLDVILIALQLYMWLVIAAAILSWLIAFNVVNTRNQLVATVSEFLYRITEPALRPIRQLLPNLGGIDISPVILFLIIIFIERVILLYIYPSVF